VVVDDPSGGADNELTIERRAADAELGSFTFVYRTENGRILTFDEAFDELTPQMAEGLEGLPPEDQVIDGGDVEEFIFESGIYETLTVEGRIVTQYTDGRTRWTNDQLREQGFPTSDHGDLSFEDWRAAQVDAGTLTAVDVLQYVGYEDEGEDADEETVITERLIID
jgi:PAS domain-containing protein